MISVLVDLVGIILESPVRKFLISVGASIRWLFLALCAKKPSYRSLAKQQKVLNFFLGLFTMILLLLSTLYVLVIFYS